MSGARLARGTPADDRPLAEGESVLLWRRDGESIAVKLVRGGQVLDGKGVLDLTAHIGASPGGEVVWAGQSFRLLRPDLPDRLALLRRKAQIVTPKDAQYLLHLAGVTPGDVVVESGSGSGALTLVLATAVGPSGRIVSFDRRPDFLKVAAGNVASAGLSDRVEFREADVAVAGFGDVRADAVVLDLPEPWAVAGAAHAALRPGGRIATFTPTYNQLERTVRELRSTGFAEVRSVELLERTLHVGEGGTRPEFEMLGHTGFLTGARKVT